MIQWYEFLTFKKEFSSDCHANSFWQKFHKDKNDLEEIFQSNLKTVKWLTLTHTRITHLTNVISHLESLIQAHDLMLLYCFIYKQSSLSNYLSPSYSKLHLISLAQNTITYKSQIYLHEEISTSVRLACPLLYLSSHTVTTGKNI